MAQSAPTSSTTQIRLPSRVRSAQIAQGSWVSRLPQVAQTFTRAAASASASARGESSWSRRFKSAKAARLADRGPRPGSLESRLISRSISGPADAAKSELRHAGHPGERSGRLGHQLGRALVELALGVGVSGGHQVTDHVSLAGDHQAVVDVDAGDLTGAPQGDLDQAVARLAQQHHLLQLLLRLAHLLLHGLGLLHQRGEVFHLAAPVRGRGSVSTVVPLLTIWTTTS